MIDQAGRAAPVALKGEKADSGKNGVAGNRNSPWEARRVSNGEDMLLPKIRGLDASKALNNDPATAGIAVVAFDRLVAEECRAPAAGMLPVPFWT